MIIDDNKRLEDIQKEFSGLFPGLRLAFYKNKHENHKGSPKAEQYDADMPIANVRNVHNKGELAIAPSMTIAELETAFEDDYGLHVQVFRRSNTLWLQTSVTDDWTLEKQNTKGLHSIQKT